MADTAEAEPQSNGDVTFEQQHAAAPSEDAPLEQPQGGEEEQGENGGAAAPEAATAPAQDPPLDIRQRIRVHDGQVAGAGLDLDRVPEWIQLECTGVKRLDLSYNNISAVSDIEKLKQLEELILDNNQLQDGLQLPTLKKLHTLSLNKNELSDIEPFLEMVKKSCPKLRYLSLLGNVACPNELVEKDEDDYQRYRYLVLYNLPTLKFLDSRPVGAAELAEAKRVGQFTKVVRYEEQAPEPATPTEPAPQEAANGSSPYRPLPQDLRDATTHRATIGQCKYVYYGRHSEGNRFIRNSDL